MRYIIFPIVHGVEPENIHNSFAEPLIEGIKKYLTDEEKSFFIPISYNYSHYTNARELQMFEFVEKRGWYQKLRKIKHTVGSDVLWFDKAKEGTDCFYEKFRKDLSCLIYEKKGLCKKFSLILFGHSQGSQAVFDFIFDYPCLVDGFFSAGSPITIKSGSFEDWGKVPSNLGWWVNFWNRADVISSEIGGVHPSYAIRRFCRDVEVPTGFFQSLLKHTMGIVTLVQILKSHICYWKSDIVHKKIAEKIKEAMRS